MGDVLTVSGLVGLAAFGFNLGSSSTSAGTTLSPQEVRELFRLWNNALMTGNPDTVAMRYTKGAVLLTTTSDILRTDYDGIRDYFVHFLEKKPIRKILISYGKCSIN